MIRKFIGLKYVTQIQIIDQIRNPGSDRFNAICSVASEDFRYPILSRESQYQFYDPVPGFYLAFIDFENEKIIAQTSDFATGGSFYYNKASK